MNKQHLTPPPPPPPLYHNVAVMTSLLIYLVLKLILECLLSSTATVTSHYFKWDATRVGSFLAILGLLMFPAHFLVAIMSRHFEDREIVIATEVLILIGTIAIVGYFPGHYSVYQYIAASVCCFLGTNMLEAPNMSILSKSIPSSWARGTFNSGLLATESGTLGRVLGDFIISAWQELIAF
jgi:MFS family permease